jgi:hypothetical protein
MQSPSISFGSIVWESVSNLSSTVEEQGSSSFHTWSSVPRLSPEPSELASSQQPRGVRGGSTQAQRNARATGNWARRRYVLDDGWFPLDGGDDDSSEVDDVLAHDSSSASSSSGSTGSVTQHTQADPIKSGKSHKQVAHEIDEGWRSLQTTMRAEALESGWMDRACERHDRQSEVQQRQQLACEGWRLHVCAGEGGGRRPCVTETCSQDTLRAAAGRECAKAAAVRAQATPTNTDIRVRSLRQVTYFSQSCRDVLFQPIWECRCGECFSASPIQARCWPSRHHDGLTWVDIDLLKDYAELGCLGGIASTRARFGVGYGPCDCRL